MTANNLNDNDDYISVLTNSGFFSKIDAQAFSEKFEELSILPVRDSSHCIVIKARRYGKWHIVKRLKPQYSKAPFYIRLLEKEFEIGYQLDHPNIAKVVDKEYDDNGMYIISEFIDGCTLRERMNDPAFGADSALIKKIVFEINEALSYIHSKQIIHRDLKPENILITHNGNNVKIIDFGLSDSDYHHVFKSAAGTRKYAAPEQLNEVSSSTYKSDYYSLGVILLEILTGQADVSNLTGVKDPFRNVVLRCLQIDVSKRYGYRDVKSNILSQRSNTKIPIFYLAAGLMVVGLVGGFWVLNNKGILDENEGYLNDDITHSTQSNDLDSVQVDSLILPKNEHLSTIEESETLASFEEQEKDSFELLQNKILVVDRPTLLDSSPELTLENELVQQARQLIPELFDDFLTKYKDVAITLENDEEAGVEWGKLKTQIVPAAIEKFYEKLEPGSHIEYQCKGIIDGEFEKHKKMVISMFEYSLEQRGIPSERKSMYMYKMHSMYYDSLMANMRVGRVNDEAIARFRDSTRKYDPYRLASKEVIQSIVVPEDFEF